MGTTTGSVEVEVGSMGVCSLGLGACSLGLGGQCVTGLLCLSVQLKLV